MSFGQQFLAGQKFAQGLVETYRDAQQRRELAAIADAKPVEEGELAAPQVQQIEAAAADGTKHIGYDTSTKAYMATPKLGENEMGPAQPVEIARQKTMTEFLGKKTPGTMTPEQVTGARQVAMAEVISKSDPIQGMRLQREMKQGEREDKRWTRENDKATEDEDFRKGQQAEFGQTIYGKRMGEYATQVQAFEQYQARAKAGEAPATLGAPPPAPQRPAYTVAESLADGGRLLAYKASRGKADPAELVQFAEKFQKVTDEGYGKALKLAQGGAPLAKVIEQFNQSGGVKLDPSAVLSDEMVQGQGGAPARVITFRDQDGKTQTINALSELDAIGQAETFFSRFDKNRTFDLNERKTAVAERQAGNAERKTDLMMAGVLARNSGGGRGGSGQGTPPVWDDKADAYLRDRYTAKDPVTGEVRVDGSGLQFGKTLALAASQNNGGDYTKGLGYAFQVDNELRAAAKDKSGNYDPKRHEELRREALAPRGGQASAKAGAPSAPPPSKPPASETRRQDAAAPKNPAPYTPPADSPAGKAQTARESSRTASMQLEAQKTKAVTDAVTAAMASKDPVAAQAAQSMPGFGALPMEQKAAIRQIVFGR